MKTQEQILLQEEKDIARRKVLKPRLHSVKVQSAQAYEVGNKFGVICGGNLAQFIPFNDKKGIDYPKLFHSVESAQMFIDHDYRAAIANSDMDRMIERLR